MITSNITPKRPKVAIPSSHYQIFAMEMFEDRPPVSRTDKISHQLALDKAKAE